MQLTSLHRGASVGGWDMGTSRVGMVKSTSVNPPFLFSVEDWCVCVSERKRYITWQSVCIKKVHGKISNMIFIFTTYIQESVSSSTRKLAHKSNVLAH